MSAVKPASCAPSKTFWLELTGKQSLANHEYILRESDLDKGTHNEVVVPMEACGDHKGRMGPILAGHIEQPKQRSLVLQLKGDETIQLPIISEEIIAPTTLKAPQRIYQDHLMVSVHPTLLCDAGELIHPRPGTGYDEVIAAPLRTGWVYVFFYGRLWRELSVTTSETAAPVLRDIALDKARKASADAANQRAAVGPELDVIHIPAKLSGRNVYAQVHFAFSETQWSWHYITELEQNTDLVKARCRNGMAIKAFLERQPDNLYSDWQRLDEITPMRARDNPLESDVTFPAQWLQDIDGAQTSKAQAALIEQRDAIEADQYSVDADYYINAPSLYPRWRQLHLQGDALPQISAGTDVFETLRGRHLVTLHLRDSLQGARQLAQQMNAAMALMLALVNNIKKRPFGVTAELFHNNFRRETLPNGTANPLYIDGGWFDNRLDESDDGRLKRTVYDAERAALRHFLSQAQSTLVRSLTNNDSANLTATLRDLFALESGNAVAGYFQAGPFLQLLSLPAYRVDPLVLPQETGRDNSDAKTLALNIATGQHPLGRMLLPFAVEADQCRVGDATNADLKAMVQALDDLNQTMRVLEPNVLRSIADYQDQSRAPDGVAITGMVRSSTGAFSGVAGEISQWWLSTVQAELEQKGAMFTADVSRIKGAFEGFAEAAIPGRTRVELEGADQGRAFVVLDVVNEQGQTLTSGAAAGAALRVTDADVFDGTVKTSLSSAGCIRAPPVRWGYRVCWWYLMFGTCGKRL